MIRYKTMILDNPLSLKPVRNSVSDLVLRSAEDSVKVLVRKSVFYSVWNAVKLVESSVFDSVQNYDFR